MVYPDGCGENYVSSRGLNQDHQFFEHARQLSLWTSEAPVNLWNDSCSAVPEPRRKKGGLFDAKTGELPPLVKLVETVSPAQAEKGLDWSLTESSETRSPSEATTRSYTIPDAYWADRWLERTVNHLHWRRGIEFGQRHDDNSPEKETLLYAQRTFRSRNETHDETYPLDSIGFIFRQMYDAMPSHKTSNGVSHAGGLYRIAQVLEQVQKAGVVTDDEVNHAVQDRKEGVYALLERINVLASLDERLKLASVFFPANNEELERQEEQAYLVGERLMFSIDALIGEYKSMIPERRKLFKSGIKYGPEIFGKYWEDVVELFEFKPEWTALQDLVPPPDDDVHPSGNKNCLIHDLAEVRKAVAARRHRHAV